MACQLIETSGVNALVLVPLPRLEAAAVLHISACIGGRVRLAIPQPTEWQRIGNQISVAFVFARTHFMKMPIQWWMRATQESRSSG